MADFVAVGKEGDVRDGRMSAFKVGGEEIAVANVQGALYAFGNVCTHQGCALSKGKLNGTKVTCRCHGSVFDVTNGNVLEGPAQKPVGSFEVRVDAGEIQIAV